ncbi:MAG: helix-turn-helix domain-containing protein, partial [Chloroflexi bacterium]|nr:helix-turn-helix domain-containing protein [Chloroflexota bacterium]
ASTSAPTTTSPSRSIPTSSRRAFERLSGAPSVPPAASASCASTTSRSTSSGGWSPAAASSSSYRGPSGCCSSISPQNAGKVVLHTELLTKVWGPEYRDDLQYLRVWVSRVRRKLGAAPGEPGRIKTFQGIGYLLDVEAEPSDLGTEPTDSSAGSATDVAVANDRATESAAAAARAVPMIG